MTSQTSSIPLTIVINCYFASNNKIQCLQQQNLNTWQLLKRKKIALFAIAVFGLAIVVAIFGYWLAPDNSSNANLQCVEIQAKPMGYEQLFFKIPLGNSKSEQNLFSVLAKGRINEFQYIPINSYRIAGDSLLVHKYIDEDTAVWQYFSMGREVSSTKNIRNFFETRKYHLGSDSFGRDILSRLIIGTKVSIAVGITAVLIALFLGIFLGTIAGYYKGWIDACVMWLVNVIWSIPTLLLVFALTLALGKGFFQIFMAIGLTMWVPVARLVRGQVMAVKELEYITAAKALGYGHMRIMFKHIVPNILGPVLVLAASTFATAIIVEAGLSFLGIGVQAPTPSWGLMIKENYTFIITNHPTLALIPGFAIMILVLALNIIGNALRDVLDVRQ